MKGNELRKRYLEFFESKGHLILPSASMVPQDDPSLLLIGAGMAPFKAFFTGKMMPPNTRITTSQKCIRTGDLENVGRTARHHTFFEMLGNFSFGDYFKKEAIQWAWEFLTSPEHLNLPKDKLWVTIHPEDDEAFGIWKDEVGLPAERIVRLEENFWQIGSGPCGPCSEIFIDLGEKRGCDSEVCGAGCDCDRYLEIWNLVFTQFDHDGEGNYTPLAKKNIDTGAGLERLASVMQKKASNFETDLLFPMIEKACKIGNLVYGKDEKADISLKVLADHARTMVFLIGDGVLPSNEGRGYVLRRIIRRAIRHARLLGITQPLLEELAQSVFEIMGGHYSELMEKYGFIKQVLNLEEKRFNETLQAGSDLLTTETDRLKAEGKTTLEGETAFRLYDTYGFPWELTAEILEDEGFSLDEAGFHKAMKEQQERARSARQNAEATFDIPDLRDNLKVKTIVDETATSSKVALIFASGEILSAAIEGQTVGIILEKTPFYAESGGQVGDTGILMGEFGKFIVESTKKLPDGTVYQMGKVGEGIIRVGENVSEEPNWKLRKKTARNHTATHLLQAALKEVLGDHVNQAGSYVSPERLRFDFSHFSGITQNELNEIEKRVNWAIAEEIPVVAELMSIEDAKESGATALFGEKYGDIVRVLSIGEMSKEFCGGTHVRNTSEILSFKILSEGGIGSGVRRIEAISGDLVYQWMLEKEAVLSQVAEMIKSKIDEIPQKLSSMMSESKEREEKLKRLENMNLNEKVKGLLLKFQDERIGTFNVIAAQVDAASMDELHKIGDEIKKDFQSYVAILAIAPEPEKVQILVLASKNAVENGIHAGELAKVFAQELGGNGGGKADMAQAGAKNPEKVQEGLQKTLEVLRKQLGAEQSKSK